MELSDYTEMVKDQITGFGVLETELDDEAFDNIVYKALHELNRYYNMSQLKELECTGSCIDLKEESDIESVINVYRQNPSGLSSSDSTKEDPIVMSQLQMYNIGSSYYTQDYAYRLYNWSTVQRMSNTFSTDLTFEEDKINKKLYINLPQGTPDKITIEYIPVLREPSQVVGRFWEDTLVNLSIAYAKVALGRIRTRFTQSNAL